MEEEGCGEVGPAPLRPAGERIEQVAEVTEFICRCAIEKGRETQL